MLMIFRMKLLCNVANQFRLWRGAHPVAKASSSCRPLIAGISEFPDLYKKSTRMSFIDSQNYSVILNYITSLV